MSRLQQHFHSDSSSQTLDDRSAGPCHSYRAHQFKETMENTAVCLLFPKRGTGWMPDGAGQASCKTQDPIWEQRAFLSSFAILAALRQTPLHIRTRHHFYGAPVYRHQPMQPMLFMWLYVGFLMSKDTGRSLLLRASR